MIKKTNRPLLLKENFGEKEKERKIKMTQNVIIRFLTGRKCTLLIGVTNLLEKLKDIHFIQVELRNYQIRVINHPLQLLQAKLRDHYR